jgi:hypothetical protein
MPKSLSFPNLHTMGLILTNPERSELAMASVTTWELPSLVFVQLNLGGCQGQPKLIEQFFTVYGPKLTSLQVSRLNIPNLQVLVAEHCSLVEDLAVLNYHGQDHSTHFAASFPRLRRIRLLEEKFNIVVLEQFLECVSSITRPSLQRIEACDFRSTLTSDVDVNQVVKLVKLWGKDNVRLEDGEGMMLDVSIAARVAHRDRGKSLRA